MFNIKLMQSLGYRRKIIGRWLFPVPSALFSELDSMKCQSDAIRGGMTGLGNLFGFHFHNRAFLLSQSSEIILNTHLKLPAPTAVIPVRTASPLSYS